ncbi:MAG: TetR/AcrR family transcriptional regulator [Holophagales bacterium]|jgi:TetR/AcrR family fatty acid metabolism transcriptional regulator|nr:TetR/AcrR family transcriptional regulator [Holophagales bacterium]
MPGTSKKLRELLEPVRIREIGEAALRVVSRKGLEGMTMQEIADEAGLAKGTLYLYFDSREELVVHVAESAFQELHLAVTEALGREGTFPDRLAAATLTHVEFFEHRRDLFRLFLSVAHPGPGADHSARHHRSGHPLYRAYLDLFASFFAAGQARGEIRPFPPDRLALFVAEGLAGLILRRLGETDPPPVEEDVRLVVDALTGGIHVRRTP